MKARKINAIAINQPMMHKPSGTIGKVYGLNVDSNSNEMVSLRWLSPTAGNGTNSEWFPVKEMTAVPVVKKPVKKAPATRRKPAAATPNT